MKITALVAVAAVAAGASRAAQPNASTKKVQICVFTGQDLLIVPQAERIAAQMFASIGVAINWRPLRKCPAEAIQISLTDHTSKDYLPGSLAFAQPYEGTHIRIFYDRVKEVATPHLLPSKLAHVMVHEITHILQGVVRHSETGVMKARWDETDYAEMNKHPLPFTETDIILIHQGLDSRNAPHEGKINFEVQDHYRDRRALAQN
jgi:hypothetical protein